MYLCIVPHRPPPLPRISMSTGNIFQADPSAQWVYVNIELGGAGGTRRYLPRSDRADEKISNWQNFVHQRSRGKAAVHSRKGRPRGLKRPVRRRRRRRNRPRHQRRCATATRLALTNGAKLGPASVPPIGCSASAGGVRGWGLAVPPGSGRAGRRMDIIF